MSTDMPLLWEERKMQVQLEKSDALIVGFGGTTLLTLIILGAIYTGHSITQRSAVPQPINVVAAQPAVTIAVPQAPAPKVEVSSSAPHIDVHVPTAAAPTVNVTTPPATVTVVERAEKADAPKAIPVAPAPKVETKPIPASLETKQHSEAKEDISIDALYAYAEKYIDSYCRKSSLDPDSEQRKWDTKWKSRVATAVNDGGSEQSLMDRTIIDYRDCFDLNSAPDRVVEGCRLLLRIRDAKLGMLDAMKNAMTRENLMKTVAFLQAGVK
jgi:hypothetical protein